MAKRLWPGCYTTRTAKQFSAVFAQKWSAVMLEQLSLWKTSELGSVNFQHLLLTRSRGEKGNDHWDAVPPKQHQVRMQKFAEVKVQISVTALYSQLGAAFVPPCTISQIPNSIVSFMSKYSHKNCELWNILQCFTSWLQTPPPPTKQKEGYPLECLEEGKNTLLNCKTTPRMWKMGGPESAPVWARSRTWFIWFTLSATVEIGASYQRDLPCSLSFVL